MASSPDVSIIVPVYNDPAGIQRTLKSVVRAAADHPVEILVVDNDSTDRTPEVVESLQADHPIISLYHEREIQSSYAARNTGIREANGATLIFLDADMTVEGDWLDRALDRFDAQQSAYMGCHVTQPLPDNDTLAGRWDHHTGFPVEQYIETQQFAPTSCLVVRRSLFEEIGLFDHRLISGGDKEFGNRVAEAGYELDFAKEAKLYHPVRNSIQELVKKDLRVGRGLCQLQRYHPDRYGRPGVPPRPSGIKRPDRDLSRQDRVLFGLLTRGLTGVRAIGYYREYVVGSSSTAEGLPRL